MRYSQAGQIGRNDALILPAAKGPRPFSKLGNTLASRRQLPSSRPGVAAQARPLQESDTERRLRESADVDARVTTVYSIADVHRELEQAGDLLTVLEIESSEVCQTGYAEEPEIHYKVDQEKALAPCRVIKHVFQRTARDSPDVRFLALEVDTEEGKEACKQLNVEVIPTVQFWKSGKKLWEHKGIVELENDLGEGVLFYGNQAGNKVRPSDYIKEVSSEAELEAWLKSQGNNELKVLNVCLTSATPCVHIFPAVLALARNMEGAASFARLVADSNDSSGKMAQSFNVTQVPTFIFFKDGKELGRHVGSSRGDLIGQILQQQSVLGIQPPQPKGRAARR